MRLTLRLGRRFASEAGFPSASLDLPEGATAARLLEEIAARAPNLSCLDERGRTVDLSVASLSVNGRAVDPRAPEKVALKGGDEAYLFGVVSGG
jgi:molybdopterin converting factor small subunit